MTKNAKITIRVTPEFKGLLERLAEEESRSVTGYLEWLVKRDAQRKARTDAKHRRG